MRYRLTVLALLLSSCAEDPVYASKRQKGVPFAVFPPEGAQAVRPEAAPEAAVPDRVGGVPTHPRLLPVPRPIVFEPEPISPAALANGIQIFVAEDHDVPLVHLTVFLRTGVLEEPADRAGVAELAGALLRTGGAGEWDPEAFDEFLEGMGASLSSGIGRDQGTVSLSCRTQDLDRGLAALRAVLLEPRFDERRFQLVRDRAIDGIRRRRDRPEELAGVCAAELFFGTDSPWAREPSAEAVATLTRDDIVAFHRAHVAPCLWSVAVSGDVERGAVIERLEALLGAAPRRDGMGPEPPPAPGIRTPKVVLIAKAIEQGTVILGHAGLPNLVDGKPHPDRYAMQVLNYVLGGGGFISRLTMEVRVRRGLSYSVWSAMPMESARGSVQMGCGTRTEKVAEAVACMREALEGLQRDGITEEELKTAKEAIANAFVFRVATPEARATNAAVYEFAGFPEDYLTRYVQNLSAVTREDVRRVAREHCRPGELSMAVCGDPSLKEALSAFGEVEVREP